MRCPDASTSSARRSPAHERSSSSSSPRRWRARTRSRSGCAVAAGRNRRRPRGRRVAWRRGGARARCGRPHGHTSTTRTRGRRSGTGTRWPPVPVGLGRGGVLGRRIGVEPVSELEPAVPQTALDTSDETWRRCDRSLDVLGEHADVKDAIHTAHGTRRSRRSTRRRVDRGDVLRHPPVLQHVGHDVRHHSPWCCLLDGHVAQPVPQEVADVEQVRAGGREDRDVTGPPRRSFALGAVGGEVDEVASVLLTTFSCSWFSSGSELENVPVRRRRELIRTASSPPGARHPALRASRRPRRSGSRGR